MSKYNLKYIEDNDLILSKVIAGSNAHGTNLPESDIDIKGIYICELDDLITGDYPEQISDKSNDTVYYEIGRYLSLMMTNNPTVLETLFTPKDCVIFDSPLLDEMYANRMKFISKLCKNSFIGYTKAQIKKATGLDKKTNWEKDKITRKCPVDFCYVIEEYSTITLNQFLEERGMKQEYCGLIKVPHSRDNYALYYNEDLNYRGIISKDSTTVRVSSVPKGEQFICNMVFNHDQYSVHNREYRSYITWLENRNTQRYVDIEEHGQKIDGKNMLHCVRLTDIAREIANGEGINVRRYNIEELINIRKGKVSLEKIVSRVNDDIKKIEELFDKSDLQEEPDLVLKNKILVNIRKSFYKI
jgi:uncharacterized protein